MAIKRIQNRIAESRMSLSLASIYALLVWFAAGTIEHERWLEFAFMIVSTYLMVELNNVNALIRIYSRMVSCSFIFLTSMVCSRFITVESSILQLAFIAFYYLSFFSYQDKQSQGRLFYAFLCLGVASVVFIKVLYLLPFLWILIATNLMSLTFRSFIASLLGLIVPYWFLAAFEVYEGHFASFIDHFASLASFEPLFNYASLSVHQIATAAFVIVLALIGIIHFLRTSYNDNIRTRMLYEIFITIDLGCIAFLVLQPTYYNDLLALIIINTSPLIAHYVALTKTMITNISFFLILLTTLLLTAFNIWMA